MSTVLAAIGGAQMEVLTERVAKRRQIFDWYREELDGVEEIAFMPEIPGAVGNRWLTTLTFERSDPEVIRRHLESQNIESRPLWKPMHAQPLFAGAKAVLSGVSDDLFARGLCLPSGSQMEREDVRRVAEAIREVLA
jgi:UDP-N-acetylbacillosamine transaminase